MSELVVGSEQLHNFLYTAVEEGVRSSFGPSSRGIADYVARTLANQVNKPEVNYRRGDGQKLPIELFFRAVDEGNRAVQRQKLQTLGDRLMLLLGFCPDYFEQRVGKDNLQRYRDLGSVAYSMVGSAQPFEPTRRIYQLVSQAFEEVVDTLDMVANRDRRLRGLVTRADPGQILPKGVLVFPGNLN